ncbi:hypothetical protein CDN99_24445 [Roseateles aquatilis]|uniref:Uncharacterized protein n=1 Tax=Roseateles aquatilis TaxID=431061 RepID=A0A246IW34_9BURK|nr:hypothetical protein [Roseateles aquatilis]OWQ84442.1 hypothetical protein CDN99_24445 [Roseateles aquatilis]
MGERSAAIERTAPDREAAAQRSVAHERPSGGEPTLQAWVDGSARVVAQRQHIAAMRGPVVQRATIKVKGMQRKMLAFKGGRAESFQTFLLHKGYTVDVGEVETTVETGETGAATLIAFLQEFNTFEREQAQIAREVDPHDAIVPAARKEIERLHAGSDIRLLDNEGKNNCGIYLVTPEAGRPLIIKVLSKGLGEAQATLERVPGLRDRYGHLPGQDKIAIGAPLGVQALNASGFPYALMTFAAHGVMTLDRALRGQTLSVEDLAAAAQGLGARIAAFHVSPMERGDVEEGDDPSFLVHLDLNTSNIMLAEDGVAGLVDVDGVKIGTLEMVRWDLSSLLGSLGMALELRYPKGEHGELAAKVFQAMKAGFARGYRDRMARVKGGEAILEKLADRLD